MIIGMCWDTTATNTGPDLGSATLFESMMMRAILWIACRHHMGELHVKHPDIRIRVINTKAPEDIMFKRFQAVFQSLPPCNYRFYKWPDNLQQPRDFLTTRAFEVLEWCTLKMQQGTFNNQRDDYRELCELVVVYLGGQIVRKRKDDTLEHLDFVMKHPGAFHHVRFLAKALYLIKMSMLAHILPEDVLPSDRRDRVDRMAKFIVLFHAKYFLQAFLPAAAPRLDLQYWMDMIEFQGNDPDIATEVQQSILRHLWYLTEELIVLSLFDCELAPEIRTDLALTLLSHPKPLFFAPQKPKFPDHQLLLNNPKIQDFVGPRSWLLFHLLDMTDHLWLNLPCEEWTLNIQYQEIENIVLDLAVTNDTAERAVKKVTDYANSANDGGQRGKIVEVAAWHHSKMSAYTKDDLENAL